MKNSSYTARACFLAATFLATAGWGSEAEAADPQRRGVQLEGMIGGSGCLPGRAPCRHDELLFYGHTAPSFGLGASAGFRPFRWFMVGGLYRYGMFDADFHIDDGASFSSAGQHTFAAMFRPIIPIWRIDLGLNLAPGIGRQVFRFDRGRDRDVAQGFSFLTGPTVDVYLTEHFFLGAEVDFIFNSRRSVCQRRGANTTCTESPTRNVAPTHQALFGLHFGGTFG